MPDRGISSQAVYDHGLRTRTQPLAVLVLVLGIVGRVSKFYNTIARQCDYQQHHRVNASTTKTARDGKDAEEDDNRAIL